ncbi:acetyl ornithine aminotransferase family protein [Dethiosulfatarculus sandiegensis]|uniref:4-aminobutyrate aminotransferase n=1 Tax=Dethiosulfatarculus sandiegensis TaxID=1429043 RepID=A0A0D2HPL9_9BACT|nr:acetyl ornithine aminotransferase family protein [Dethiosulfatarculus sandiegensis]KIX12438.1 4-aminobutyrate aminotransferase [Dethiosulfatarculus sandiegensis]
MKAPHIQTVLPGPKASEQIKADKAFVSPSYTRAYPLVVDKAQGLVIQDVDGNRFLDFTAGIAVTTTGHCHPKVVEAIRNQAGRLLHMSGTDFYYEPQIDLAQKLATLAPGDKPKKAFFCNSGAEAVEASFKLARWHTRRELNIAFYGAFHGRTMGALSLTASKSIQKKHYHPFVPGITHIPYAYCYRCPYNLTYPACELECVRWIEENLFRTTMSPDQIGAIFVEPVQGEGGYVVPPKGYLEALRKLTKKYGILLVADEVQSGMGRTGKMYAVEHAGVVPDIIAMAKGIASGLPLGAIVAPTEIMDWEAGSHASTFGGNPVACAAAVATIDLLQNELMENAAKQGEHLKKGLFEMQKQRECIGDVRGLGLMVGAEIVKDRHTKERGSDWRNAIVQKAFEKGLLLLGCGENTIRFCPGLVVSSEEIDTCLNILDEVIKEVAG